MVVLTGNFTVHGNTIVLDHGWGVNTIYNHLDHVDVSQNAVVNVAANWDNGRNRRVHWPHLHWGLIIQKCG